MKITRFTVACGAALLMLSPLARVSAASVHDLRFVGASRFVAPHKEALDTLGPHATKIQIHTRMLRLDPGVTLSRQSAQLRKGQKTYQYEQLFHGIPIYRTPITVIEDERGELVDVSGWIVSGLASDVPTVVAKITPSDALKRAEDDWSAQSGPVVKFENGQVRKVVYVDERQGGHLAYVTLFQAWKSGNQTPVVPQVIVDASTGKILEKVDTLVQSERDQAHSNARNE